MNVRVQLFGQKWQRVVSSFVDVYSRSIACIEADEGRVVPRRLTTRSVSNAAPIAPASPRVRVDVDLGVGHALLDVVDLRLERGEVVLRAALEHERAAERGHARDLHDVLPDVLRQHLREAREQLLLRVALLLEVHAVGVEEHGAAVAELRRELGLEGDVGVLGDRDAELSRPSPAAACRCRPSTGSTAGSSVMSPFCMNRTLMSCPPMSQMTSTSPKKCTAHIMCATVSTMFTSALHATPRARRRRSRWRRSR